MMSPEAWIFLGLVGVGIAWAWATMQRHGRQVQHAMRDVDRALDDAKRMQTRIDDLECAVEEYVQVTRNGSKAAACRTKPRSPSR